MKGSSPTLGALFVLFTLATIAPAFAAPPHTGNTNLMNYSTCITVGTYSTSFPANTPFFIQHGWANANWNNSTDNPPAVRTDLTNPGTNFTLLVDGNLARSILFYTFTRGGDILFKFYLTNFAGGMAGTHTFTGLWYDHQVGLAITCTETVTFT